MCDSNLRGVRGQDFFAECNKTTAETYSTLTNIYGNEMYYARVSEWHNRFLHNQEERIMIQNLLGPKTTNQ